MHPRYGGGCGPRGTMGPSEREMPRVVVLTYGLFCFGSFQIGCNDVAACTNLRFVWTEAKQKPTNPAVAQNSKTEVFQNIERYGGDTSNVEPGMLGTGRNG